MNVGVKKMVLIRMIYLVSFSKPVHSSPLPAEALKPTLEQFSSSIFHQDTHVNVGWLCLQR